MKFKWHAEQKTIQFRSTLMRWVFHKKHLGVGSTESQTLILFATGNEQKTRSVLLLTGKLSIAQFVMVVTAIITQVND